MNRSKISNLKELDEAQVQLHSEIEFKKKCLDRSLRDVRSFYTPSSLVNNAISDIFPVSSLRGIILDIITDLRKKVGER